MAIFNWQRMINVYNLVLFSLVTIAAVDFLLFSPSLKGKCRLTVRINQVLEGWNKIKGDRILIFKLCGLAFLNTLSIATSVFVIFKGLNAYIGFPNAVYYSVIQSVVNFVNLTLGGLGINEAVLMFSADVVGVNADTVLLGTLLVRGINLVVSILLVGISYLVLNYGLHKFPGRQETENRS